MTGDERGEPMKAVSLAYSRSEVNKAGDLLRSLDSPLEQRQWAAVVLGNWRAVHYYPINTFQATLRHRLKAIDRDALVAQRLKRFPTIVVKLRRFPDMELSRMQDIGGLRAVVGSLEQVQKLHDSYKYGHLDHGLVNEKNYIDQPKSSGYRGIHLVYRYHNDRTPDYDGLYIEIQLRTRKQHAWATAVETMGIFLNSALKSSEGPDSWLDFFALTGSAFARLEGTNAVPGFENLTSTETFQAVAQKSRQLKVREKLTGFGIATEAIHRDKGNGSYYLLVLDPENKSVLLRPYGKDRYDVATADYLREEESIIRTESQKQAVLVATASVAALESAYPNFFLNTREFLRILREIENKADRA